MKLLIDADIYIYRCLHATSDRGYYSGIRAIDYTIDRTLDWLSPSSVSIVLSGSGNFRKQICSTYKANRKPESRPPYLHDAKQYAKKYWDAIESVGEEADDLIGKMVTDDCMIAGFDKDYRQLGVPIYDPWKNRIIETTNPDFYFWQQMLIGDDADGIDGVTNPDKRHHKKPPNFSEDTSSKVLEGKTSKEMRAVVQDIYEVIYRDDWFNEFDTKARLLFLRRNNATEYYDIL